MKPRCQHLDSGIVLEVPGFTKEDLKSTKTLKIKGPCQRGPVSHMYCRPSERPSTGWQAGQRRAPAESGN